ncbi:hypothetical protein CR532_05055, partial (plasmid) [Candidatus Borreliella tachyglossi]
KLTNSPTIANIKVKINYIRQNRKLEISKKMLAWLHKSSLNLRISNQHKIMRARAFDLFKECMIIAIDSFSSNGKLFNIKELKYEFRQVLVNRGYNVVSKGAMIKDFFDHFTGFNKKSEIKLKGIGKTQFHTQETIKNTIIPAEVTRLTAALEFKNKDTIYENAEILTYLLEQILLSKSKIVIMDLFQFDALKDKFSHLSKSRYKKLLEVLNRNIVLIKEKIKVKESQQGRFMLNLHPTAEHRNPEDL